MFFSIILVSVILYKHLICLVLFRKGCCRARTGSLRREREGVGTTENGVLSQGNMMLTSGGSIYAVSIVRGRVGRPRTIVTVLMGRLEVPRRGIHGQMRGCSSLRGVGDGISGRAKGQVLTCNCTKIGISRSCGQGCPCSALTSGILKFANKSGRKVVKLRDICSGCLRKASNLVLAAASTHNIRISGVKRRHGRPITKGGLHASLSTGVRVFTVRTTGGTCVRGRTSSIDVVIVGPSSKTIVTVISCPRFRLGRPFRLVRRCGRCRNAGGRRRCYGQV